MPDSSDCIWAIPLSFLRRELVFKVEGQIGVIKCDGNTHHYHTTTGTLLQPVQAPLRPSSPGHNPRGRLCGRHYFHYHNLSRSDTLPEGSWYPSKTALRKGWVRDPEGRHRLWLYSEWMMSWDHADWRYDITTQFSMIGSQPVIIMF